MQFHFIFGALQQDRSPLLELRGPTTNKAALVLSDSSELCDHTGAVESHAQQTLAKPGLELL